jgi:hypothetical protein
MNFLVVIFKFKTILIVEQVRFFLISVSFSFNVLGVSKRIEGWPPNKVHNLG